MAIAAATLHFSLFQGGPLYWLSQRAGLAAGNRGRVQLGLVLAAITWLPLLVLNTVHGGMDTAVSFTWSLGTHTRFLVAIPLFLAAEATFGGRAGEALGQIVDSKLVRPTDPRSFAAILRDALARLGAGRGRAGGGDDRADPGRGARGPSRRRVELARDGCGNRRPVHAGRLVVHGREPAGVPVPGVAVVLAPPDLGRGPVA